MQSIFFFPDEQSCLFCLSKSRVIRQILLQARKLKTKLVDNSKYYIQKNITLEFRIDADFSTILINWAQSSRTGLANILKHIAIIIG